MGIERIKCAATRHGDHIIAGANHAECLRISVLCPDTFGHHPDQGFLTTNMRFISRKEALIIAEREDQIVKKHLPLDILLPEDLKEQA